MELIDVLDKKGNVIGQKERKEVFKDGDLHRTVHIWIMNSNKELLVQKRSPKKDSFPNLWAISTAGHVKSGETSIKAVLRELKEELGIKKNAEDIEFLFSIRRHDKMEDGSIINTIDDVYLIEEDLDVENTKLQFTELTDIKYVYYEYLEQIYKNKDPEYVPYCEEHIKLFKYLHDRFDEHDNIKVLYKTENLHTLSDYEKIYDYLYGKDHSFNMIALCMLIVFAGLVTIYCLSSNGILLNILIGISFGYYVFMMLLPRYKFSKAFESNKLINDMNIEYIFYENYFTIKSKKMNLKVQYDELYRVIETNDCYYIFVSMNDIFIVAKNNIESSFNSFIKNKVICSYKRYGTRV